MKITKTVTVVKKQVPNTFDAIIKYAKTLGKKWHKDSDGQVSHGDRCVLGNILAQVDPDAEDYPDAETVNEALFIPESLAERIIDANDCPVDQFTSVPRKRDRERLLKLLGLPQD